MANEVTLPETGVEVKLRRPWLVVAFSIVTVGIYSLVWYYKVNREMRDFGSAHGDSKLAGSRPVWSVVAVSVGGLILIPEIVSFVRAVGRVRSVERIAIGTARSGVAPSAMYVASVLLSVTSRVHGLQPLLFLSVPLYMAAIASIQVRLNTVWQRVAGADTEQSSGQLAAGQAR